MPDILYEDFMKKLTENTGGVSEQISILNAGFNTIMMSLVVSLILSILYLVFIRYFAGIFVWVVIFIYFACLLGLSACFYLNIGLEETTGSISKEDG